MKKVLITSLVMLLCLNSMVALAEDKKTIKARVERMSDEEKDARYLQMSLRVTEIKNMDKSSLTKEQTKELRKELKDMNREAKAMGKTVSYVSIGISLLLIAILLVNYL